MPIEKIVSFLKQKTGLDSSSVGIPVVERAVLGRMKDCSCMAYDEYLARVTSDKDELISLINSVMVPETWFFRGQETFDYLRGYIIGQQLKNGQDLRLRVLAIPCSTGEEPYSIAITFNECGAHETQYTIDAYDIATISLEKAKNAVYTDHSFRGVSDEMKDRYFYLEHDGYHLKHEITKLVNYSSGNLLELNVDENSKYDIVFCRNLLIYFDSETQSNALKKIHSFLSDDGLLFIGHGEAGCIDSKLYKRVEKTNAFGFVKRDKQDNSDTIRNITRKIACSGQAKQTIRPKDEKISENNDITKGLTQEIESIANANKLADEGKLEEALTACKNVIKKHGVSADVFSIMGVVHDALGNRDTAIMYYKRALHLCPAHKPALMHLASHAERNGEEEMLIMYKKMARDAEK